MLRTGLDSVVFVPATPCDDDRFLASVLCTAVVEALLWMIFTVPAVACWMYVIVRVAGPVHAKAQPA